MTRRALAPIAQRARERRKNRTRKETFSGASRADGALVRAASSAGLAPASPVLLYTLRKVPGVGGAGGRWKTASGARAAAGIKGGDE